METVASKVSFTELCGLLEKIQRQQGTDKKKRVLKDFIEKWRDFHTDLHKDEDETMDCFYPAMRLLLPHLERERMVYGIKEHTFAKLLIEVLCLGKDSPDANRLIHFKAPKTARADAGDFASVAYFVLKSRCPERGSLTIQDVNDDLDAIAIGNANKAKETVRKHILNLLRHLSATEIKWLIRMIVKELKMGLSQASVLNVYHPDAEELYNVNNSLEKVCHLLQDPKTRSHEIGITVFSPFSPMLGERAAPDTVEKVMENKEYFIETKYDGERVLLHKDGDEYKYFSRSANEYTQVFGANAFEGTLTPYIANCFKPNVKCCILDGEMLGYHAASKTFGTKGESFDVKAKDLFERTGYQPCVQVFDVLLLNDRVLTNTPLKDRLPQIEDIFVPIHGRIIRSEYKKATTNQECAEALNVAIDNKEEGIMVKLADSVYKPNTRKGGWFKIKPEYVGGLMDELDLLVVGGYFGVGARGGQISHFLCAVAVPNDNGDPEVFHSFCKVGSGYSKKQLSDFNEQLASHWQVYDKKKPPKHLELATGFKEKPDLWIPPDKSSLVQVKASEIIDSDKYKTGCTLRFPRVEMIRDDKPWNECMTIADIQDLKEKSGGKLVANRFELGAGNEPVKKKRKTMVRSIRPTLMSQFRGADVSKVTKLSGLLEGKEFCIINGPSSCPKTEMEKKILELGASVVQNPDTSTLCVVVEKMNARVNNLVQRAKYDIVKASWLMQVIDSSAWVPWSPGDMIHTTAATKKAFESDFDGYGDSYTMDTDEEKLRKIFQQMTDVQAVTAEDIVQIEEEHFPDDSPYGLFRTCRVYMDNCLVVGDASARIPNSSLELLVLELRFFGASVSDSLDLSVSHVVVEESDLSRLSQLKEVRRTRDRKFHIISEKWIRACLEEGVLCKERGHEL